MTVMQAADVAYQTGGASFTDVVFFCIFSAIIAVLVHKWYLIDELDEEIQATPYCPYCEQRKFEEFCSTCGTETVVRSRTTYNVHENNYDSVPIDF
jgi:hypothetical protein